MPAVFIPRAGLSLGSKTNACPKHLPTKLFPEALTETTQLLPLTWKPFRLPGGTSPEAVATKPQPAERPVSSMRTSLKCSS